MGLFLLISLTLIGWYYNFSIMESTRKPIQYEPQEKIRSFVLRLPEKYALVLDGLVEKGAARSKNELIVEVIGRFLSDLQKEAEEKKNGERF